MVSLLSISGEEDLVLEHYFSEWKESILSLEESFGGIGIPLVTSVGNINEFVSEVDTGLVVKIGEVDGVLLSHV